MSGKPEEVAVTWEDQQNINTFGRLNQHFHEIETEIADRKRRLEDLEDASNELTLADEDEYHMVVGEAFFHMPQDTAEERLEEETKAVEEKVKVLEGEMEGVKEKMEELKTVLYAKFGKNINLEEE